MVLIHIQVGLWYVLHASDMCMYLKILNTGRNCSLCPYEPQTRGGIIVEQNRGRTRPKDPRLWCAFPLSAHAPRTRALRHFLRATE